MMWMPIESAPQDTTEGDFLIACWTRHGDCAWVQLVRNPNNHHGLSIATHWAALIAPLNESIRDQQDRLDAKSWLVAEGNNRISMDETVSCGGCEFWERDEPVAPRRRWWQRQREIPIPEMGLCRRYPEPSEQHQDDWCGEWVERERGARPLMSLRIAPP